MRPLVCDARHVEDVKKYASLLGAFLSHYSWLNDAYVLDYFVEQQWFKLPASWQAVLSGVDLGDLSTWLESGVPVQGRLVWPLSLMCLAPVAKMLTLSRRPVASPADVPLLTPKSSTDDKDLEWPTFDLHGNRNLSHAFRKHVKLKKQHEITRLAMVVELLAQKCGCQHVLDVGSGQGHLARLLALDKQLRVATVDLVGSHLASAQRFDHQAVLHVQKKAAGEESKTSEPPGVLPQHVELEVSMTTTPTELEQVAKKAWGTGVSDVHNFIFVGLHTCGDLGPSMIRLFADSPAARGLVSVGCCYMKLNESKHEGADMKQAYPMSSHVRAMGNRSTLSYQAREVACHAIEMYAKKLKGAVFVPIVTLEHALDALSLWRSVSGGLFPILPVISYKSSGNRDSPMALKIHCYRALLERLIVNRYSDQRHCGLGCVKHASSMTFAEYAKKALHKFPFPLSGEDMDAPELELAMNEWQRVVIFYSLRLLLAPVIESLILVDRMLYLWDQCIPSCLVSLFDPCLSPRNLVLLAFKGDSRSGE